MTEEKIPYHVEQEHAQQQEKGQLPSDVPSQRRSLRVGQRRPTRDPVKNDEAPTERATNEAKFGKNPQKQNVARPAKLWLSVRFGEARLLVQESDGRAIQTVRSTVSAKKPKIL